MRRDVIPTLRYRDARKSIDFLVEAFGLTVHRLVEDGDEIAHAELTFGEGMVMVGDSRETDWGSLVTSPTEAGKPTSGVYLVVEDPYAHAEQARRSGAEIVRDPVDQHYGGASYTARDLEGYIWDFGSYDPWAT